MKGLLIILAVLASSQAVCKPKVYFNYHVFFTPENESYISSILQFDGGSVKYFGDKEGNLFSRLQITHLFMKRDSVILVDKYLLTSPAMKDSTVEDFYDTRNYSLPPGVYDYELIIKDELTGEEIAGKQAVKIEAGKQGEIAMSDIEYIQDAYKTTEENNFTKNGFFILPYLTNYYPPEMDKVAFYFEIYNADQALSAEEDYLISYTIVDRQSKKEVDGIFQFQRLKASAITPIIGFLPIKKLPTGNYDLNFTLVNKESDTIFQKLSYFERRSNIPKRELIDMEYIQIDQTFMTKIPNDSIPYFLQSLMPISPRFEYESIRKLLKSQDLEAMKRYFYSYWVATAEGSPEVEWNRYRTQVYAAEEEFGTQIKHAFETDRGRVYLRYGPPNDLVDRPSELGTLPYQIWRYYRIDQRSDVRFVFYNPDLVTNDFPLLHSELPGEIQNYRWQTVLTDQTPSNIDDPGDNSLFYGGNSNLYYINP